MLVYNQNIAYFFKQSNAQWPEKKDYPIQSITVYYINIAAVKVD